MHIMYAVENLLFDMAVSLLRHSPNFQPSDWTEAIDILTYALSYEIEKYETLEEFQDVAEFARHACSFHCSHQILQGVPFVTEGQIAVGVDEFFSSITGPSSPKWLLDEKMWVAGRVEVICKAAMQPLI